MILIPTYNVAMTEEASTIDVIVTASYSATSNSVSPLKQTVQSILNFDDFKNGNISFNLIIAIDGLHLRYCSRRHIRRRQKWIKKVHNLTIKSGSVVVNPEWGHLSGSLSYVVNHYCKSPFILIVQDDLKFIQNIPLKEILDCIDYNSSLLHIRFNKRRTVLAGGDTSLAQLKIGSLNFVKTNNWSDNNYITTLKHFKETLMPLFCEEKTFPENILRPLNHNQPEKFGTYIFGKLDDEPLIVHLGDRRGRIRARFGDGQILLRMPWTYQLIDVAIRLFDLIRRSLHRYQK